jgi:hypothetical protein
MKKNLIIIITCFCLGCTYTPQYIVNKPPVKRVEYQRECDFNVGYFFLIMLEAAHIYVDYRIWRSWH